MNARWLRVKELFRQAQEVADAERQAWLAVNCVDDADLRDEVERLLAAQREPDPLLSGDAQSVIAEWSPDEDDASEVAPGTRIGAYRLLRVIGAGGMGRVYLAERADGQFTQQVALKRIRGAVLTPELRQRFQREREVLARLAHPHIAQLHDGGVDDEGMPYFTLEYVDGQPMTAWCDVRRLELRARAALLLKICDAVQYAHGHLVVHRDIKPSNILVSGDGEPKLLDFGIAKPLDDALGSTLTGSQAQPMTREFAAPEQVLGEPATTATDVYALGVLFYLLLCGRMPYRGAALGTASWNKAILQDAPEPMAAAILRTPADAEAIATARASTPAALQRALRGDPERIVRRALAKQPASRYPTVDALAADLRAWLDGRALAGGTRTYRLRKFVRRHWLPLGAAAALLATILGGAAIMLADARRLAREAQTTSAVKDFLLDLFTAVDPHLSKGRSVDARKLLDRGAARIAQDSRLDALQLAEIKATLGRIYYQLGVFDRADALQAQALAALAGRADAVLLRARTQAERALTLVELGNLKASGELADSARRSIDSRPDSNLADRIAAIHAQASAAIAQRDFAKVERYANEELPLARQIAVRQPKPLYHALMSAGVASWGLHEYDTALARWREAVDVASHGKDLDELDTAIARINVSMALAEQSHYGQASEVAQQALAVEDKELGSDHPTVLNARRSLALYTFHQGRYREARALLEQVLPAQRKLLGQFHPAVAGTEINYGLLLIQDGDATAAVRVLDEATRIFRAKYGPDYEGARVALGDLAAAHIELGMLDLAHAELQGLSDQDKKAGRTPDLVDEDRLGDVERREGHYAAAIALQREALAIALKDYGGNQRYIASTHFYLAQSLRDSGDAAGAAREYRAALTAYASYIPNAEHPLAATVRYELGDVLRKDVATRAEGIKLLSEAMAIREKFFGADDARTRQARAALIAAQASH
jgi:serine/threonine protein kinase